MDQGHSDGEKNSEVQFKALRDEMLSLFNRVFVVLAAVIAASGALAKWVVDSSSPRDALVLGGIVQAIILVGALLTNHLYALVYSVGSYITTFLEADHVGWHLRSRFVRLPRGGGAGGEHPHLRAKRGWPNEPQIVAGSYAGMSLLALVPPLLQFRPTRWETADHPATWGVAFLLLLSLLNMFVVVRLWDVVKREVSASMGIWNAQRKWELENRRDAGKIMRQHVLEFAKRPPKSGSTASVPASDTLPLGDEAADQEVRE